MCYGSLELARRRQNLPHVWSVGRLWFIWAMLGNWGTERYTDLCNVDKMSFLGLQSCTQSLHNEWCCIYSFIYLESIYIYIYIHLFSYTHMSYAYLRIINWHHADRRPNRFSSTDFAPSSLPQLYTCCEIRGIDTVWIAKFNLAMVVMHNQDVTWIAISQRIFGAWAPALTGCERNWHGSCIAVKITVPVWPAGAGNAHPIGGSARAKNEAQKHGQRVSRICGRWSFLIVCSCWLHRHLLNWFGNKFCSTKIAALWMDLGKL